MELPDIKSLLPSFSRCWLYRKEHRIRNNYSCCFESLKIDLVWIQWATRNGKGWQTISLNSPDCNLSLYVIYDVLDETHFSRPRRPIYISAESISLLKICESSCFVSDILENPFKISSALEICTATTRSVVTRCCIFYSIYVLINQYIWLQKSDARKWNAELVKKLHNIVGNYFLQKFYQTFRHS